ncbi:MAG: Flp family type IVb pilin [Clostridiales bacterium]|nr:Flp family type IVb pilin [Clostridiales bacterium]MCF8023047.1 Flp family type IVb pilin [Clostridiales bacterium]
MPTEAFRLLYEETGQGMAEYALILLFIALACISGLKLLGESIANPIQSVTSELS